MKKFITLSLLIVVITTLVFPFQAMAQYDKELESAIKTAKTLLNINEEYDEFNYNINKYNDKTQYDLMWNDSKNKLGNINVTIDSDGKIIRLYKYKPYMDKKLRKLPAVSKTDALETANAFIKKVAPDYWNNVKYQDENSPLNINDREYRFEYIRVENGIPFPMNRLNVGVDNVTGEVRSFHTNWNEEIKFPDTKGIMTNEDAEKAYREKLGLVLAYKLKSDKNDSKPYLVYTYPYNNRFIDAKTGEVVFGRDYSAYYEEKNMHSYADAEGQVGSLTPKEREAVDGAADIMDEQEVEKKVRAIFDIDETFNLDSINLHKNGQNQNEFIWNLYFNKEEKKDRDIQHQSFSVSINAKTGEVINFYKSFPYSKDAVVKYNMDQSMNIAQDFIKSMQPDCFNEVEYTDWDNQNIIKPIIEGEKPRQYSFIFTRKVDNAYFLNNGFRVTVDTVTGTVVNYNFTWYKGEIPAANGMINTDEAHKILFDTVGIETQYIQNYASEYYEKVMPRTDETKPEIRLVYTTKPGKPLNIDAFSGELLDYSGETYQTTKITQYNDIKGSYAENQIKVLAQFGISLPGEEFKPDQNITQREFLYLILKTDRSYYNFDISDDKDDERLYNSLINVGMIKEGEWNPDSVISRQDAVKFIIRALDYEEVAKIKGIFVLPFKDADEINSDLYGYVAIANGLEIVRGNNGYFNPDTNLTRAQAAVMIYNLLNVG